MFKGINVKRERGGREKETCKERDKERSVKIDEQRF